MLLTLHAHMQLFTYDSSLPPSQQKPFLKPSPPSHQGPRLTGSRGPALPLTCVYHTHTAHWLFTSSHVLLLTMRSLNIKASLSSLSPAPLQCLRWRIHSKQAPVIHTFLCGLARTMGISYLSGLNFYVLCSLIAPLKWQCYRTRKRL